jgi:serine/threonine protein kinase
MQNKQSQTFGSYVVKSLLGESPLGHTYLATHKFLGTDAVVKVLDNIQLTKDDITKLTRSARLWFDMSHPALLRLYDFGEVNRTIYYVSQYIERGNLRDAYPQEGYSKHMKWVWFMGIYALKVSSWIPVTNYSGLTLAFSLPC